MSNNGKTTEWLWREDKVREWREKEQLKTENETANGKTFFLGSNDTPISPKKQLRACLGSLKIVAPFLYLNFSW